jgi:hypothetical protein
MLPEDSLDKMAAILSDGTTTIRASAPKPLDDAHIAAKLREEAGVRSHRWAGFVDRLESLDKAALPE